MLVDRRTVGVFFLGRCCVLTLLSLSLARTLSRTVLTDLVMCACARPCTKSMRNSETMQGACAKNGINRSRTKTRYTHKTDAVIWQAGDIHIHAH